MAGVKGRSGGHNRRSADEHRLRGTFRRDRHGSDDQRLGVLPASPGDRLRNAAGSDPVVLAPPAGLVKAERAYWRQFAPLLTSAQTLTPADVETLADYCRACANVDERGRRLRTAFRKRKLEAALVRMLDQQLRGWIEKKTRLATELGLTAIARTRVAWSGHGQRIDPVERPQSKLAQLQEQAAQLKRPVRVR